MNQFLFSAALLVALAAGFVVWPLIHHHASRWPLAVVAAVLLLFGGTAGGYLMWHRGWQAALSDASGDPVAGATSGPATIARLARQLERTPQDRDGWLALGAAYSEAGQYPFALRAYRRADRLSEGTSVAALAGMGEALVLGSAEGSPGALEADVYLERALKLAPDSPKVLFISALNAYRNGHLDIARARFAAMLQQPLPDNIHLALQKQIDEIDAQLHPRIDAATAIHLHLTLAPALQARLPAQAMLFVFVRAPGGGPPLAVRRLAATLPQDLVLSAADAVAAGRGVSPAQSVQVMARITASGNPVAQSGDLYGQIEAVAGRPAVQPLVLDRVTP